MNNSWIYIGADIHRPKWSKVGKTTIGLNTRHTSPQSTGYFIFTAFNIVRGDVHEIESNLLNYLNCQHDIVREHHFSTGNLSECFLLGPIDMVMLVERFISDKYSQCVTYETSLHGEMSRYMCDRNTYLWFDKYDTSSVLSPRAIPNSLNLTSKSYYSGNQEEYEIDLGGGYYVDVSSGLQKHRDDDHDCDLDEF